MKKRFRFQDFEIWQRAIELADDLYDVADLIEEKKKFRMAEQLRAAVLSISNNIAEGSGSFSDKDFANFLNMSRRSAFEVANMIILLKRKGFLTEEQEDNYLGLLDVLSKQITNFRKKLI